MARRVSRSEDDIPRTTLRVEFRVGIEDLAKAAGYAIEFETCETAASLVPSKALPALTRADVLDAAHTMYHEFGEVGAISAAGENLDRPFVSRGGSLISKDDCLAHVRKLFPEFEEANSDA